MPRVGNQHFPYTEAGYAAAAKAKKARGYQTGGSVGMSNPFLQIPPLTGRFDPPPAPTAEPGSTAPQSPRIPSNWDKLFKTAKPTPPPGQNPPPSPVGGGIFSGQQYVDDPVLNGLYNDLQMTIQSSAGTRALTPEEAAASSQAQRQLEQQIIAAGGKPYQYFTELPHGGFTEERGPRPGYDPMTGTYPENFTNPPKPEELLNKIDGVRTQSNWGTPEQMDNANWMVKMGLAPDLATAKAEVLKTARISSAPTPPSSVTPGRNEELKGLSNEDWLKKMFPGTPPPPTPINEMSYSTISDQPYANSSSSNMADYENSQPLPPPPPPATADMTTMQNPYVFGGYGAPPSMPYAGMATPQIPSIMGMAPPSYYGGSAQPVGMADPTQRVS